MKRSAFILMIIGIFSKGLGFVRYITLAQFYGASNVSDAYLIALTIPLSLFQFFGDSISTTLIPIYNRLLAQEKKGTASRFMSNLMNILTIVCTTIILLSILFAPLLVKLFASGFNSEIFDLAVNLMRIMVIGIYFSVLMSILRGYLYAIKRYYVPQLIGFPFNMIIILATIISSQTNIYVLAYGTLLAMFIEFAIVAFASYKEGLRYTFRVDFKDGNIKSMLFLSTPTLIGTSVNQLNNLVDRTFASRIIIGGITVLDYASRLIFFIHQIFVLSISIVIYPVISKMAVEKDFKGLKKSLIGAIKGVFLLIIPATIGAIIFAEPLVTLLFKRGQFNQDAVKLTATALIFYSIGMVAFGLREVLSRAFYALQDTKTPMINASIGMLFNIIFNLSLSKYMGIGGLALATSLAAILTTSLLLKGLKKKLGPFGIRKMSVEVLKIVCAAIIMGFIAKLSFNYFTANMSLMISLFLAVGIGGIVYFGILYWLKFEELNNHLKKFLQSHKF